MNIISLTAYKRAGKIAKVQELINCFVFINTAISKKKIKKNKKRKEKE